MNSAFVYIAYSVDDTPEVAEIANAVRSAGWGVCFGRLAPPDADYASLNMERLQAAACVLVVWSSNAAGSSAVRSDAAEAARQFKLVLVTLDDAAPPIPGRSGVQLEGWFAGTDSGALDSMIDEISELVGPRKKGWGRTVPYASRRQVHARWQVIGAGAVASAGLGVILGVALQLGPRPADPSDPTQTASPSAPPASESLGNTSGERGLAAMIHWAEVPQQDLPAIRGFIREHEGTRAADEARQVVARLEQVAWKGILDKDDLPDQLDALANFLIDFPDGEHAAKATELGASGRQALQETEADLITLGFASAKGRTDLARLRTGVQAFERSVGLAPSGRITKNLSVSLAVAAESRRGRSGH